MALISDGSTTNTLISFISSVDIESQSLTPFYELRNHFVHAVQQKKRKLRDVQNNEQVDEIVEDAIDILRKMLKKCVDEKILPSVENRQRNISNES